MNVVLGLLADATEYLGRTVAVRVVTLPLDLALVAAEVGSRVSLAVGRLWDYPATHAVPFDD